VVVYSSVKRKSYWLVSLERLKVITAHCIVLVAEIIC